MIPITTALSSLLLCCAAPAAVPTDGGWRSDPVWHDGQAEKCVYEATRTIYGRERRYQALAYTNQEHADPRTTCKSESGAGVAVFKHHWSERVPTEAYDYDFSTMSYTRVEDLSAFKLTAATQEDCGASFKELWRDGAKLRWSESVYFPGAGRREGSVSGDAVFFDALTLRLRGYDFEGRRDLELLVVPMQKDTRAVSFEPERRTVRFAGTGDEDLPIGTVRAHELHVVRPDGGVEARLWFAAEGAAPWLHVCVRYEGPQGVTYRLAARERTAYWKRG